MVSADNQLQAVEGRFLGRWGDPRLLLAIVFIALCALATVVQLNASSTPPAEGSQWSLSQWLHDRGFHLASRDPSIGADGQGSQALSAQPWHQHRVCGRIRQIVEAACAYESADHDSEVYWACVTGELKYTMWSAYNCD